MKDNNNKQVLLFWLVLVIFIIVFWLHERFAPDRSAVWPVKFSAQTVRLAEGKGSPAEAAGRGTFVETGGGLVCRLPG